MDIVYMGTGEIGIPTLESLLENSEHALAGVYTQPDRPAGRSRALTAPAIKELAQSRGIPVFQPEKIRDPEALEELRALEPEVIVVFAYGQILPREILETPSLACINLHASLLPRHRGAAPIQAAIAEGDSETGITIIYVGEELDAGDILLAEPFAIDPGETGQSLHDRFARKSPAALERALELLGQGSAPRTPQDHHRATHCPKLSKGDGRIDWNRSAAEIERGLRAYHPWPGTTTCWRPAGEEDATVLKLFPPAQPADDAGLGGGAANLPTTPPGTVLEAAEGGIVVGTGDLPLRIHELQQGGRRRMSAGDFLRGAKLSPGDRFE
ncbi:MAG: methionyl-tRNA formyltransferase [Verrucomicrobiales bacterium]